MTSKHLHHKFASSPKPPTPQLHTSRRPLHLAFPLLSELFCWSCYLCQCFVLVYRHLGSPPCSQSRPWPFCSFSTYKTLRGLDHSLGKRKRVPLPAARLRNKEEKAKASRRLPATPAEEKEAKKRSPDAWPRDTVCSRTRHCSITPRLSRTRRVAKAEQTRSKQIQTPSRIAADLLSHHHGFIQTTPAWRQSSSSLASCKYNLLHTWPQLALQPC